MFVALTKKPIFMSEENKPSEEELLKNIDNQHEELMQEEGLTLQDLPNNIKSKIKGYKLSLIRYLKSGDGKYIEAINSQSYTITALINDWLESQEQSEEVTETEKEKTEVKVEVKKVETAASKTEVEKEEKQPKKKSGWGWVLGGVLFALGTIVGVKMYNNSKN